MPDDWKGFRYKQLMNRHSFDWKKFCELVLSNEPIPECYQKMVDIVNPYMAFSFGNFVLSERLQDDKSGFYHAYHGLFCEALQGELTPLTGIKVGNVSLNDNNPIAYDEDYFKQHPEL
jgi:hypothetical protein